MATPNAPLILVIEDIAKKRAWLARELSEGGYAVEEVATGAAALVRCRERRFDAITLDMLLPDMSDREVLGKIRERGYNTDTSLIIDSVVSERGMEMAYGVKEILSKPVSRGEILKALKDCGVQPNKRRPILVADDDRSALKLADKTLRGLGSRGVQTRRVQRAQNRVPRAPGRYGPRSGDSGDQRL